DNLLKYFENHRVEREILERKWVSRRTQTLFRTISGFMKYLKAMKLLYNTKKLENKISRKFRILISVQKFNKFNKEEKEDINYLLDNFKNLQIAYLEEVQPENGNEPIFYSVLIDGRCETLENGDRIPKYRIQLPGNPILGDGKADNQNHAIIFCRGEYLQVIDANQDNYLEECLKLLNVLREFNVMPDDLPHDVNPSSPLNDEELETDPYPIAIVGIPEYVFSENYGVLGDIIAGKARAFSTISQSNMAMLGVRLHYGHSDFMYTIFMMINGGVSKAQKGLHLNEDIYAGYNARHRGGRIKHIDYMQCGKGRDLGFESIRRFITKTSTGMGEQILSRDQYYFGKQLSLDELVTFFFGHLGLHSNSILVMLLVELLVLYMIWIGIMRDVLPVCEKEIQDESCYDFTYINNRIQYYIFWIILASTTDYLLSFSRTWIEKGLKHSFNRLKDQVKSFLPLYEIFSIQSYSNGV